MESPTAISLRRRGPHLRGNTHSPGHLGPRCQHPGQKGSREASERESRHHAIFAFPAKQWPWVVLQLAANCPLLGAPRRPTAPPPKAAAARYPCPIRCFACGNQSVCAEVMPARVTCKAGTATCHPTVCGWGLVCPRGPTAAPLQRRLPMARGSSLRYRRPLTPPRSLSTRSDSRASWFRTYQFSP